MLETQSKSAEKYLTGAPMAHVIIHHVPDPETWGMETALAAFPTLELAASDASDG